MLKNVYVLSSNTTDSILKCFNNYAQAYSNKSQAIRFLKEWYDYFNKNDYTILKWEREKSYTKDIYTATIEYNGYDKQILHITFIINSNLVCFKEEF